jgi:hypothetical protein
MFSTLINTKKIGEESPENIEDKKVKKVKLSRYTPWRHMGGRGGIAPTHS